MSKEAIDANDVEEQTIGDEYAEELAEPEDVTEESEELEEEPEEKPEESEEDESEEDESEDESEPEDDSEESEEEQEEEPKVPLSVLRARINKKNEQMAAKDAEIARLSGQKPPEAQLPPQPMPQHAPATPRPVEGDYENPDDFLVAKAKWEATQEWEQRVAVQQQQAQAAQAQAAQKELETTYESKVDAALAKNPDEFKDFEDAEAFVVSAGFNPMAIRSIMTAELPAHIVRYLHNKPAEALRIARLEPLQQVEEIGYLKKKSTVKPKKKQITKAPEPVNPERGDATPPKKLKFKRDMSLNDYDKLRKQKGEEATLADLGLD
jgi:hypothetical protein